MEAEAVCYWIPDRLREVSEQAQRAEEVDVVTSELKLIFSDSIKWHYDKESLWLFCELKLKANGTDHVVQT